MLKFCLYDVLCRAMYNVGAYALVKHALHVLQQFKKTTRGIAGSVCRCASCFNFKGVLVMAGNYVITGRRE